MDASLIALIGSIVAIAGTIYGIYTNKKRNDTDTKDSGKELGIVASDLGYIKSGIDDIKRKQESEEKDIGMLKVSVARIEGDLNLHKDRLNDYGRRIGRLEDTMLHDNE